MSSASGNAAGSSAVRDAPSVQSLRTALRRSVVAPVQFLAFWAAVLLPLAYLPLVHGGLSGGESTVLLALVVANVVAVVAGHGYRARE